MVNAWTAEMPAGERVEIIATTLSEPRTVNWVADQSDVSWDTAKHHLDRLADSGVILVTEDGRYVPDGTRAYFDALRDLILNHDKESLRDELAAIADRIAGWEETYEVNSIQELEATLAEDRPAEDVHDRRRALRRWENSVETRDMIRNALGLYDDVRALSDEEPRPSAVEGAG